MPCLTPNHDLALIVDEDAMNLAVSRFYRERPQLFRRISKAMDTRTPFDPELDPIAIGESGHSIEYEFKVLAPADGKFIDLFPAHDDRTGAVAASGELLLKCGLLARFWDRAAGRRWRIELPVTAKCFPVVAGQNERLDAREAIVGGLAPPPFQAAVNYAALHLLKSALARLKVPGNFLLKAPASVTIAIEDLKVDRNLLEVDAAVIF